MLSLAAARLLQRAGLWCCRHACECVKHATKYAAAAAAAAVLQVVLVLANLSLWLWWWTP
jgi:hypothetical protein